MKQCLFSGAGPGSRFFWGLLAALLLCAGCMVGPDYHSPDAQTPGDWSKYPDPAIVPGEADVRKWWRVFGDAQLTSLINRAETGNKTLKEAVARVKAARARIGVASGNLLPAVNTPAEVTRQMASESEVAPDSRQSLTRHRVGLDAGWELDFFGRIRRSVEAAEADYSASREDRVDVLITLYAEVAVNYIKLRAAQNRLRSARENITSQREVLGLTKSRFRNGLATALDVAQAQSVLASSQADLHPLRAGIANSLNNLTLLLGLHPGALDWELGREGPIPAPPAQVTVGVPADLVRRRPDIRKAERRLAAETARIGVATADLYPTFSLVGTFGYSALNSGDWFNSASQFYSFGPTFYWPLFAGGRIRSQIKVQDAMTEQALVSYEQTILVALADVETAMVAFVEQRDQVLALAKTATADRRTLALALKLYKEGLKDFQGVLDAQRALFNTDSRLAEAKGDAAANLVRLYKALGGGWDPDQETESRALGQEEKGNPKPL